MEVGGRYLVSLISLVSARCAVSPILSVAAQSRFSKWNTTWRNRLFVLSDEGSKARNFVY